MRRSIDELLNELHKMIDSLGGGSVNYDGVGYTARLEKHGVFYADTFTGIKKELLKVQDEKKEQNATGTHKAVIFTIRTWYSVEHFYLPFTEEEEQKEGIEILIDDFLAAICFCDEYKVISYKEPKANTYYLINDTEHIDHYSKSIDKLFNYTAGLEEAKIYYNGILVWKK